MEPTGWVSGCLPARSGRLGCRKSDGQSASALETSVPGVFAVGDVRSGSVKRVASAVGEGSMVVQFVHAHLAPKTAAVG